jgi:TPR repeat protein
MMVDQRANELTTPELPNITRLVPFERHLSAIRRQFIRGVLTGILVSCAVAMPAFKYSNMRQRGASSQQGSGKTAVENPDAQAGSRARKFTPETSGTSFPTPVLPKPRPSKPSNDFPDNPVKPVLSSDGPKSPVSFHVSQPAPLTGVSFPEPQPTKKTVVTTPQKLWSSVQAGDTKAAVALADLYLRGDGVPVNCDQARVLLLVASKENDADATKKLQDLEETGCPAP